ncbi:ABC transporter ATP-binding protein [Mycolicibacterium smegmatis]|uniref:ABC transporter ATP-binding protein n=1 Tax=Mycolicibacterium smegmatis TaxID=1772 RepID=UPI001E4926DC|nr:sn-glycerol-3-phosphate ABC transporter ATP-binding protein UgpC [Mycolicibacterium smegmatis]UGU29950.1 sn-glycerol-3-phosphate ABC transporter ATP-binding protein UgpC [Mycolicibacterium smegmatis]ULN35921.1 sn-glycerol-3-phosphate ABC transporter ATP-binding protein UgpC [Mycolicibacterium smegmatis]ULN70886.1 sn-glycerol-3-phosphate ABC transporter ATP-binding protein UgpC [Mycolicibacterium smegmatis]
MAAIRFEKAQLRYPHAPTPAVAELDLDIADGEFMVLVGPSGCGKSTTLRMLAGLEDLTSGSIYLDDRDITTTPPQDRDIAMVFQNYALYPHMTVAGNMEFCLKNAGLSKDERRRRVAAAAETLGLTEYLNRKPKALSGGQRQRVAMGRAIVRNPQVFCMDEPLSNLDAKMRVQTRTDIAKLQRELGVTTIYVTHDQTEAMTMGDRVGVMKDGVLQQVGAPMDLYDRPANAFVAGFIGSPAMKFFDAQLGDRTVGVAGHDMAVQCAADLRGPVLIGVRPEGWRLTAPDAGIAVKVGVVEVLGADSYLYGTVIHAGADVDVVVRVSTRDGIRADDTVHVTADPDAIHLFANETGVRLN